VDELQKKIDFFRSLRVFNGFYFSQMAELLNLVATKYCKAVVQHATALIEKENTLFQVGLFLSSLFSLLFFSLFHLFLFLFPLTFPFQLFYTSYNQVTGAMCVVINDLDYLANKMGVLLSQVERIHTERLQQKEEEGRARINQEQQRGQGNSEREVGEREKAERELRRKSEAVKQVMQATGTEMVTFIQSTKATVMSAIVNKV
jgi:hypothetical protein